MVTSRVSTVSCVCPRETPSCPIVFVCICNHRKTLHHPTRNIAVLEQRLNAVEFFLNSKNHSVVENLSSCLRHVYRLTNTVLACCSGPQAKPSNWYKLHKVRFFVPIPLVAESSYKRYTNDPWALLVQSNGFICLFRPFRT